MNDLIQTIKIFEPNELKIVNDYIDTLKFEDCKVLNLKHVIFQLLTVALFLIYLSML